jgi:hypothetical protein
MNSIFNFCMTQLVVEHFDILLRPVLQSGPGLHQEPTAGILRVGDCWKFCAQWDLHWGPSLTTVLKDDATVKLCSVVIMCLNS